MDCRTSRIMLCCASEVATPPNSAARYCRAVRGRPGRDECGVSGWI